MIATLFAAAGWIAGAYAPPAESDTASFFAPARNAIVERTFPVRDVAVKSAVWHVAAPGMRDLFVDEWMIRHVLGISVCDDAVGCDKVRIAPQPIPGVTSASGWFDTPKGRITVSWKVVDGRIDVKREVPDGVSVLDPK